MTALIFGSSRVNQSARETERAGDDHGAGRSHPVGQGAGQIRQTQKWNRYEVNIANWRLFDP